MKRTESCRKFEAGKKHAQADSADRIRLLPWSPSSSDRLFGLLPLGATPAEITAPSLGV